MLRRPTHDHGIARAPEMPPTIRRSGASSRERHGGRIGYGERSGTEGVDTRGQGQTLGAGKPLQLPLTLADLITAVQDVVDPEDDGLVVATVRHLLRAGQLTGRGSRTCRRPSFCRDQGVSQSLKEEARRPNTEASEWLCGRLQVAEDSGERPALKPIAQRKGGEGAIGEGSLAGRRLLSRYWWGWGR